MRGRGGRHHAAPPAQLAVGGLRAGWGGGRRRGDGGRRRRRGGGCAGAGPCAHGDAPRRGRRGRGGVAAPPVPVERRGRGGGQCTSGGVAGSTGWRGGKKGREQGSGGGAVARRHHGCRAIAGPGPGRGGSIIDSPHPHRQNHILLHAPVHISTYCYSVCPYLRSLTAYARSIRYKQIIHLLAWVAHLWPSAVAPPGPGGTPKNEQFQRYITRRLFHVT